ncbi:hypothetical protein BKA81DRAFT_396014 [Phyllosticta paracitricarpa]
MTMLLTRNWDDAATNGAIDHGGGGNLQTSVKKIQRGSIFYQNHQPDEVRACKSKAGSSYGGFLVWHCFGAGEHGPSRIRGQDLVLRHDAHLGPVESYKEPILDHLIDANLSGLDAGLLDGNEDANGSFQGVWDHDFAGFNARQDNCDDCVDCIIASLVLTLARMMASVAFSIGAGKGSEAAVDLEGARSRGDVK